MTNEQMLEVAMKQSAEDINCTWEDFTKNENVMVKSILGKNARKYYSEPIACNLVSYGNNVVASVKDEYMDIVKEYINKFQDYSCFETPQLLQLDDELRKRGQRVCFMAEYFLPDINLLKPILCDYELRILGQEDFKDLYVSEWSNALCSKRKELDVLGVGAYDKGRLIGLAACSADCEDMWQIGVDVLSEYRRKGIASAMTSHLALEILNREKVPFYCAAWSNIKSVRNAIKCGFRPAWIELTSKPEEIWTELTSKS